MGSGEALMAKNFVRGVMIIQKNDSGRGGPPPPCLDAQRLSRAIGTVDFKSLVNPHIYAVCVPGTAGKRGRRAAFAWKAGPGNGGRVARAGETVLRSRRGLKKAG